MGKNIDQQRNVAKKPGFWGKISPVKTTVQQERSVSFSFKAPDAYAVSVAGSFNEWTPGSFSLQREETGVWKGIFSLKPGVYEYRFYVNMHWADDPNAKKTVVNDFGTKNAVIEVK